MTNDVRRAVALVILRHVDQGATQCGSPMSPSANWQALTIRHTETVRQRDDCPLGQASPRFGRLAMRASVRSLVFGSLWPRTKRAATGLSQAHGVLWLGTLGHPLIESKTPFHGRFEVPALFLPNRANNAISGPPEYGGDQLTVGRATQPVRRKLIVEVRFAEENNAPWILGLVNLVCHGWCTGIMRLNVRLKRRSTAAVVFGTW